MIRLLVQNLMTGESKAYELNRLYDLDQIAADYGHNILSIVDGLKSVRAAADRIAQYLSSHHLNAKVIDPEDHEEISSPDIEMMHNKDVKPQNVSDLKDVLEDYDPVEFIDIPEMHVLNNAVNWKK